MEDIMHRTRTAACLLAGLASIWAATALPAFAMPAPPLNAGFTSTSALPVVYTVMADGMPGWQITVIAVGAAVAAAFIAVLIDRTRTARRRVGASRRAAVPTR
jgi:ABC-type Na+ efflux pump permease subunit